MFHSIYKAIAPIIILSFVVLVRCTNPNQYMVSDNQGHGIAMLKIVAAANSPFQKIAKKATLSITANDMLAMARQLTISDSGIMGTVTGIPAGIGRLFTVAVYDSVDTVRYKGKATADVIADSTVKVSIRVARVSGNAVINGSIVEGDTTPMYVQFNPSLVINPLRVKQTQTSINSFTIKWDPYPKAEGYNLYWIEDDGQLHFLQKLQNPLFAKANISQRSGFGEYTPLYRYGAGYIIKPIVGGVEMKDSSKISPVLIDSSEVIYSDFLDTFSSPVLGHKYVFYYYKNQYFWQDAGISDNRQVYVDSGCLHLNHNTTDGGPFLMVMLYNDLSKDMKVNMQVKVHRVNDYDNYYLCFLTLLMFEYNTYNNKFGFYIDTTKYSDTTRYDQWTSLSIQLKRKANKLIVSYDDKSYEIDYDATNIRYSKYLGVNFGGYPWFTGHTALIDDLKIEYLPN